MRRENYKIIEKNINLNKKHTVFGAWHARPDV
jgi:hypothetical protein